VAIADRIDPPQTLAARKALDLIAAALAGCHCGQEPSSDGPTAGPTS